MSTFDGAAFYLEGQCKYTYAAFTPSNTTEPLFEVFLKAEKKYISLPHAFIDYMELKVDNYSVRIYKDLNVTVSNSIWAVWAFGTWHPQPQNLEKKRRKDNWPGL